MLLFYNTELQCALWPLGGPSGGAEPSRRMDHGSPNASVPKGMEQTLSAPLKDSLERIQGHFFRSWFIDLSNRQTQLPRGRDMKLQME